MRAEVFSLALVMLAGAARAQDTAEGERLFSRCRACHSITAPDGRQIAPGGRSGPDLYGVIGRPVASVPGFGYGPGMRAAAESGLVWDAAMLADYLADPTAWLRQATGNPRAVSRMGLRLAEGGADLAAWLEATGPGMSPGGGADD
ncbi:c-type cytochrome [Pseudogemmobacter sonorensis]|uniref:c-type cytochrome n=1 Tax=Pseudogemmobacter sonorensis TaxID=2989681 RepID=UPI003678E55E